MKKEKKKIGFFGKLFGTVGILVLIILLAAAGLGFHVYLSMKNDPVTVSSPEEYMNTAPDGSFRHLAFSDDGRMTQSYDDSDIQYFLYRYMKEEDIDLGEYAGNTGVSGLSFDGITVHLLPDQTEICAVGGYRGIRLVGRMLMDLAFSDGVITARPDLVRIAGIKVPVSVIDRLFGTDIGSMTLEYEPEEVLLSSIEKMTVSEGSISFSGPMNTFIIDEVALSRNRLMLMRLGQKEVRYAGDAIGTKGSDPAVRYRYILSTVTEKPDEFREFLKEVFSVTSWMRTNELGIGSKNCAIATRWFPDYNERDYFPLREELYDSYYVMFRHMSTISGKITSDFSSGRLRTGSDGFYYNGKPLSFRDYFGSSYKFYQLFLELEEARMCTVRKDPGSQRYAGILLRGADDYGYVLCFYSSDSYDAFVMKEEAFLDQMNKPGVPEIVLSDASLFDEYAE